MESKYEIKLNFLAIDGALPNFRVYRTPRNDGDSKPEDNVFGFSLPISQVKGETGSILGAG
jgi:hypothetical protein